MDGRRERRRGQALAETAICLPLILLAVATIVDLGWTLHASACIQTAMREGAQMASYDHYYTDDEIGGVIANCAAAAGVTSAEVTVNQTATILVNGLARRAVQVDVNHQQQLIVPIFLFPQNAVPLSFSVRCLTSGVAAR
jgi:Flp pilus assembly protein TadG